MLNYILSSLFRRQIGKGTQTHLKTLRTSLCLSETVTIHSNWSGHIYEHTVCTIILKGFSCSPWYIENSKFPYITKGQDKNHAFQTMNLLCFSVTIIILVQALFSLKNDNELTLFQSPFWLNPISRICQISI